MLRCRTAAAATLQKQVRPEFSRTILELGADRISVGVDVPLDAATIRKLQALGVGPTFAVVTPFNPLGRALPDADNLRRLADFRQQLERDGVSMVPADGWSPDRTHLERGMACHCTLEEGLALGRQWEQLAIFWFDGTRLRLVTVPSGET